MIGILLIAHAPLASALRDCALHVFPDCASGVVAIDVLPHDAPEDTLEVAAQALDNLGATQVLLLTDVFGATPCNIAQKLTDGVHTRLLAGVNLPMLLRCVSYRNESLEQLAARAVSGGMQGVMQVATTVPQNQHKRNHDQDNHDHQQ